MDKVEITKDEMKDIEYSITSEEWLDYKRYRLNIVGRIIFTICIAIVAVAVLNIGGDIFWTPIIALAAGGVLWKDELDVFDIF